IICLIAQRAPQQDLDAVQKWAAAASVVVSLIHGKPSRLPARDGKSAAQQRRRVRRFRILPQLPSQSPPVLRPRRPGRHGRAQQQQWDKGLPCPSQRRSDLAAEHWWGMLQLAWRAKLAQSERSSDYLPARSPRLSANPSPPPRGVKVPPPIPPHHAPIRGVMLREPPACPIHRSSP